MEPVVSLTPIAFFAFLAVVLVVPAWLNHRARLAALRTISEAVAKGQPLEPAMVDRLMVRPKPAVGKGFALLNLFLGVGSLSIGLALSLASLVLKQGDPDMMVGAFVNLSVGIGLTGLGLVSLELFSGRKRAAPNWDYASILALICLFLGVASLSLGVGLTLAGVLHFDAIDVADPDSGVLMGAIVTGFIGIGFTLLGVFILRLFGSTKES